MPPSNRTKLNISVIIPAYRRPDRLVRCLEALCAQTLPPECFEVIVCDDGSPVPLAPVVERFMGRLRVTVVEQTNAGPAAARNAGAARALGAFLAFTDDDCMPAPDWLARLADRVRRYPEHLIGGAIENALPGDPYATATQLVGDAVVAFYEQHLVTERFFSTSNLLVPAAGFRRLGGFSTAFPRAAGEDYDLCARWHQTGLPSVYAPEAVVRHAHAHTLRSFCRQHFDYGRGLLLVRTRMARRAARRITVEAPWFYGHLVTYPLRRGYGARGLGYACLVVLSQVATAAGGLFEALLSGRRHGVTEPARGGGSCTGSIGPGPLVRFSVVVPTYNRPAQLAACLDALAQLEAPAGDYEIIVVNDGGAPVSPPVQSGTHAFGHALALRVHDQPNAGPAAARNAGARMARGSCLAFTDDDCRPDPMWLVAFDAALRTAPDALVGGRVVNALPDNLYAITSQFLADFVSAYFAGGANGRFFTSNNIAVGRNGFLDAGAFDMRFPLSAGEDREFCDRWSAQGRPSTEVVGAVIRHAHPLTLRSFARQHFRYGRGARVFRQVRADVGRPVRIDPAFYARSLAYPFSHATGFRAPVVAALTAAAHAAYAAGLVRQARLRR